MITSDFLLLLFQVIIMIYPVEADTAPLQKKERKDLILRQVNIHTRLLYSDMVKLIDVSEDTIRRDVNELADEGLVIRIKGGAMAAAYQVGTQQEAYALSSKDIIAEKAITLLRNGIVCLLGGGTTISGFIRKIPDSLQATFFTVNVFSAAELLKKPNIKTIIIGGQISHYSQMTVSGEVFEQLSSIQADLCIMGTNAFDSIHGMTDSDWETIQVKKAMLKAADKVAILSISEKLNSKMQIRIADISDIDYLITELPPDAQALQNYKTKNISIL